MSAPVVAQMESKTAKKRKTKAESGAAAVSSSIPAGTGAATPDNIPADQTPVNGVDGQVESAYIKELQRNIRNIHKKLASSSKADSVVAENPTVSLDDLVASKKLNADQKAQVLKKPALQTQLAQLEEQLSQYRSFAQELEDRYNQQKTKVAEAQEAEIARVKEEATSHSEGANSQKLEDGLRVISHFLHAAASKRQSDDATSEEGRAFEGALLLVYQGNEASLETLKNLITGADEKVPDVNGNLLDFTFAQIKQAASADAPELGHPVEEESADSVGATDETPAEPTSSNVVTDPTIANAGLTELGDQAMVPSATSDAAADPELMSAPEQTSTGGEAANAAAEANWDPQASVTTDASVNAEEWVQVPRDPAETETGVTATPAAMHGSQSWAEEVGAAAAVEDKAKAENDGFEQVRRDRDRGGRGRGRGQRGEFRGRGRGPRGDGYRGSRGGPPRGRGGAPRGDRPAAPAPAAAAS